MAKETVKDIIFNKTKVLMQEKGSVTIKDIADATSMNIAAVNYHFGSKDKLMQQVILDVLADLKTKITEKIQKLESNKDLDNFMVEVLTLLYHFMFENAGILKYVFISLDSQVMTSNELIDTFFSDNEFTTLVYRQLNETMKTDNPKQLATRYMIIFSSVAMPMLFQLVQGRKEVVDLFSDQEFSRLYINELLSIIKKR